jgi:hypothetical protein
MRAEAGIARMSDPFGTPEPKRESKSVLDFIAEY